MLPTFVHVCCTCTITAQAPVLYTNNCNYKRNHIWNQYRRKLLIWTHRGLTWSHVSWLRTMCWNIGWFSMSPLPRLHHHDIMTIVELLHHGQDKVVLSHFNTDTQKKEGEKFYSLALALTLIVALHPDHSATRHCWRLQCSALPLTHQHYATYCNDWYIYEE